MHMYVQHSVTPLQAHCSLLNSVSVLFNMCCMHAAMSAGKIRGLHGHRWLVVACDTKLLMHDLSSNLSREVARTALDNKAPTSVAFLYINNPGLLGEAWSLIHVHVHTSAYSPLLCDMLWSNWKR